MTGNTSEKNSESLLQLSNEIGRIARTLAELSTDPQPPSSGLAHTDLPQVVPDKVLQIIRSRRRRAGYFAEDLFADPAWDMMLELFHAELTNRQVTVSGLSAASGAPPTTALRWITNLVDKSLFVRRSDPFDRRRVFIELAPETSFSLRRYFAEVVAQMLA